jgi:hypothetical protein
MVKNREKRFITLLGILHAKRQRKYFALIQPSSATNMN